MPLFVFLARYHYSGDQLLGIYQSHAEAEAAYAALTVESGVAWGDEMVIQQVQLVLQLKPSI